MSREEFYYHVDTLLHSDSFSINNYGKGGVTSSFFRLEHRVLDKLKNRESDINLDLVGRLHSVTFKNVESDKEIIK
jgi:hypothetical protein